MNVFQRAQDAYATLCTLYGEGAAPLIMSQLPFGFDVDWYTRSPSTPSVPWQPPVSIAFRL